MRWLMLVILGCSSSSIAQPARSPETVALAGKDAIAYNDDLRPVFRAELPYLLDYVGTKGQIFETRDGWVRISQDGRDGVWLNCSALTGVRSCAFAGKKSGRQNIKVRSAGIPTCPGDPRCPKKDSK